MGALEQEQAQVCEAVLRSKLGHECVVVASLNYHSPTLFDHLLASEDLKASIARVESAGCQVRPLWANGALLLFPLTETQLAEENLQLKAHNILLPASEVSSVNAALGKIPRRQRPLMKLVQFASLKFKDRVVDASDSAQRDDEGRSCDAAESGPEVGLDLQLVVERTFYTFPLPKEDMSEASAMVHSAPAAHEDPRPENPRRWRRSAAEGDVRE